MDVVRGQPGGEPAVEVAYAVRGVWIDRGDRHVEHVEERALLRSESLERVPGGDQTESRARDVVGPALAPARATTPWTPSPRRADR